MTRKTALHRLAHARAGDKGDTSSISVWAYDPAFYPSIKASLTIERIGAEFPRLIRGPIRRYEIDRLHGLNFVMERALEGGVNGSLNLDGHGKSWSYLFLGLEIEIPDEVAERMGDDGLR
jgi:hypothetical protein